MVYKSFPVVSFHPYRGTDRGIHSKDNDNAQNDGTHNEYYDVKSSIK